MREVCNHLEYISLLTFTVVGSAKILDLLDKIYCIDTACRVCLHFVETTELVPLE